MLQGQGIGSGMEADWPLPPGFAPKRLQTLRSGRMTRWLLEFDLQLMRLGMARRPTVTPLLEHLRRT
jgi:hypothetical protein